MIDFAVINSAIRNHFRDWLAAADPVEGLAALPTARPEGGTERLQAGEFTVECLPVWGQGQDEGTTDAPRYRTSGFIQINIWGPRTGLGVIERLAARVREWGRAAKTQIAGVRFYTTGPPLPLSAPAEMLGKHIDTNVLLLEDG